MKRPVPIRVLLVDDHEMVRAGIRTILKGFADLKIVGEAASAGQALEKVEQDAPDVVLLDMRLPDMSGIEACQRIVALGLEARVLFLTSFLEAETALAAVEAGAAGFLIKQIGREALHQAICGVHEGRQVLPPEVADSLAQALRSRSARQQAEARMDCLSAQEQRVAQLVAEGLLNKEIADRMGLSEKTVRNYLGNVFVKLGMNRRAQVAAFVTAQRRPSA